MCNVDHTGFTSPGYLIDVPCESIAARGVLFTRMLAHHAEIGLSGDQITRLLDLNRAYHDEQVAIRLAFAAVTEQLELKGGRLDADTLADRKALLDRHAELFRADEELFFTYAAHGHELLTDDQLARIDAIYEAEKDAGLATLETALNSAVGPHFTFGPAAVAS